MKKLIFFAVLLVVHKISVINGRVNYNNHRPHRKPTLAYFYDVRTNRTIVPPTVSFETENELFREAAPRGFGRRCDCKMSANRMANVCSCCAGLTLPRIKFQREMCTRFQYNLSQRNQMLMDVTMNGNPIASQTFYEAPDRPPFCVPLPIPFIPLRFDFCIKIFDMNFMGQNAHFCMDWSARVEMTPLILLHFDCAQFGTDGVSFLKPGQAPQQPGGNFPSILQPAGGGGAIVPAVGSGSISPVVTNPITSPITNPITSPVTNPITSPITNPVTSPVVSTFPQQITNPQTFPQSPSPNPVTGPDEMGNLPQVGAGTDDFDQVDDLKLKQNGTRFNYNY